MTGARHLVVYAKAPRMGRVKRRLAADVGVATAWSFYRASLFKVLAGLHGGGRWQRWLAVTPDAATEDCRRWARAWCPLPQGSGDLGARMARTMQDLPPGPAVIVGSDAPDVHADHIAHAFDALGRHDAVFGPADDGGYWLVGLRRRPRVPPAFRGVRWSTDHALADTLANLDGLSVAMLETLVDVDDGAALDRWRTGEGRQFTGVGREM